MVILNFECTKNRLKLVGNFGKQNEQSLGFPNKISKCRAAKVRTVSCGTYEWTCKVCFVKWSCKEIYGPNTKG